MEGKKGTEVIRADDFVEYFLFPSLDELSGNTADEKLDNFLREINESVQKFTVDYIWHKEPFQLVVRTPTTSKLFNATKGQDESVPCLHGLTFYGENIQDEWYIVEIIKHLTTIYTHVIGRVLDADGEFLLIEAAEVLPKWADPDTCTQKVFIHAGDVVLVQNTSSEGNVLLPMAVTLKRIRDNINLFKSDAILKSIEQRFVGTKKMTLTHRCCVYLPMSAALLLKRNPQIISYAVRAFCNRDSIDLKLFRAMKHFPPETRVYTQVTFTKCLYALLSCQNYKPNQRTGWSLPNEKDETYNAHILGMKIACGLEICASKLPNGQCDGIEASKTWQTFFNQLKQNGYFGDAIDGSREFTQRCDKAKQYFRIFSENHSTYIDAIAQEIHTHLKDTDTLNEQYSSEISSKYDAKLNDSEDWMNITQDEFDNMMSERYGIKKTLQCNDMADDNDAFDLGSNLNTFLNQKSEFDGVDFRPQYKDERPQPSDGSGSSDTGNTGNSIHFDPDAFQNHLKDMLDFHIPEDNWDSHSDMSDFDEENIERSIDMLVNSNAATSFSAYMEQMDRELAGTTIGSSFKSKPNSSNPGDDEDFDDIESFEPVDIDVNALKNLAESYKAQFGNHGPTSSLLSSIGMRMDNESKSHGQSNSSSNQHP